MAENATPTPGEYKADVGSGAQLEYGDANELNQSLVAGDAVENQLGPAPTATADLGLPAEDFQVEYTDADEMFTPGNEDEEILFGPTEGLGRTGPPLAKKPVPNSVLLALPLLITIANDPKTPPVIKNAYKLILQRLAAEQKAKY
jgi:hypothetical protein